LTSNKQDIVLVWISQTVTCGIWFV